MSKHDVFRRAARVGAVWALAALSLVAAQAQEAAPSASGDLLQVAVQAGADGAPVVRLEGRGLERYEAFMLDSPPRLVVDLYDVTSRLETHHYRIGEGGVLRVRAGQYRNEPERISRVVFDLETPVPYEILPGAEGLTVSFAPMAREGQGAEPAAFTPPIPEGPAAGLGQTALGADPRLLPAAAAPEPEPGVSVPDPADGPGPGTPAAGPAPSATAETAETVVPASARAIPEQALEALLAAPAYAAPAQAPERGAAERFETKLIGEQAPQYTGKRISLNLVDADIKQVFRLFHEISGLNFVLHPKVDGRVTIVLDHVPWDQALDLILKNNGLEKVLEGNVVRIAPVQELASEAALRKQLKEAKDLEVEPVTITRTLSYAKAKAVEQVIRESGVLTPRGKVIVDERTNTLIISDVPKKTEPLDQLISSLDTETPQVMIEARIVETSREFVRDFGVVWGFEAIADASRGTATNLTFPHNLSARYGLNLPGPGGASSLGFSFGNVIDSFTLDVTLNALETEGRGRILSSPKIATQNNEKAEIEQGVRIPVVNTTATEINVEFVSASLRLIVTPQITAEGTVILDVEVENNTPDFVNRVGDVPPINTQRAQTKVLINDGGTTVIGGIFSVNEGMSETGVPWFRKIPLFGWLFKSRNVTNQNRELLIFITPKIMKLS